MGQRLVINCIDENENRIGNVYYHWSAYTVSALEEALELYNNYIKESEEDDKQIRLIHAVENCGGGITGDSSDQKWSERKYIENKFPNVKFKDIKDKNGVYNYTRSDGLVSISEKEMKESDDFVEGIVDINIDKGVIEYNTNFWMYNNYDQYIEYCGYESEPEQPIFMTSPFSLNEEIDFKNVPKLIDFLLDNQGYFITDKNGFIYGMIA